MTARLDVLRLDALTVRELSDLVLCQRLALDEALAELARRSRERRCVVEHASAK